MGKKVSLTGGELLAEINRRIEEEFGEQEQDYDPLWEMVKFAHESDNPQVKMAVAKEVTPYIYAKRKPTEDDANDDGLVVQLVQFTNGDHAALISKPEEPANGELVDAKALPSLNSSAS